MLEARISRMANSAPLPATPVLGRSEQLSADALIPMPAAHRDLGNLAVEDVAVHGIRRPFESGIYESNDLIAELRYKGGGSARFRRMLTPLSRRRPLPAGGGRPASRDPMFITMAPFRDSERCPAHGRMPGIFNRIL